MLSGARRSLAFGLLAGTFALALAVAPVGTRLEEEVGLLWLFRLRGPVAPPADVFVVSLDRRSAADLGLPPAPREWPRSVLARLVDALDRHGAAVITLDLILERPQNDEEDRALAAAIARAGRVVLFEGLRRFRAPRRDEASSQASFVRLEERRRPLPAFAAAAAAVAPFPLPQVPGRLDRFWAYWSEDERRPTLPTAALQVLAEAEHSAPAQARRALERLAAGPDAYWLNFYGPPGTVSTIPFSALLASPGSAAAPSLPDLRAAAVFVGYSELASPTKEDTFETVFTREDGVAASGVELAATAFANLRTASQVVPCGRLALGLLLPAFGCALAVCAFGMRPFRALAAAIGLALCWVGCAQAAFVLAGVWLPLAIPVLLLVPVIVFASAIDRYARARRAISWYVPEGIAQQMADHPQEPMAVRRTAFATCLAGDAGNYTTFSEEMRPEAAAAHLNAYFAAIAGPLDRHRADFREFHADSVLCAWLAERADSSEVRQRACIAALEVLDAVDAFEATIAPLSLNIRLGLHAGELFLGNVGAHGRVAFRLVGDIVNAASRIESLNKPLGTRLLASERVVDDVPGLLLRPLGEFLLKGRRTSTSVVEILATHERASTAQIALCRAFAHALQALDAGRRSEAEALLAAVLADFPHDGPARFYLARARAVAGAEPQLAMGPIRIDSK